MQNPCQECGKREATVNFIENTAGGPVALHLCEQCYRYKYGEFEAAAANAFLSGLFDTQSAETRRRGKVCKGCGMRFEDYKNTGLLGCPSCYDVFKEDLMPVIEGIQGKTRHVGKGGGDHSSEHDLRLRLKNLQEQLEDALARGDYTAASKLNRQMTPIKNAIKGGTNG